MFSIIIYYHCYVYVRIMCQHDSVCVCVCVCENQVSVGVSHQPKLSLVCLSSVSAKLCLCFLAHAPPPHLPSWCSFKSVLLICVDAFPPQQVIPKVINSVGARGSDIFLSIWLQLLTLGWLMSYFYQHLGSMFMCTHMHACTHTHTHTHIHEIKHTICKQVNISGSDFQFTHRNDSIKALKSTCLFFIYF